MTALASVLGVALSFGQASTADGPPPAASASHDGAGPGETGADAVRRWRREKAAQAEAAQRRWRDEIRRRPVAQQLAYLVTAEACSAFGARRCHEILAHLKRLDQQATAAYPSGAWIDDWYLEGRRPPVEGAAAGTAPGVAPGVAAAADPEAHPHRSRMVLSQQATSFGDRPPSRRYLPPQNRSDEDFIDGQAPAEALYYPHPPSPSAQAMRQINFYRSTEFKPLTRRRKADPDDE